MEAWLDAVSIGYYIRAIKTSSREQDMKPTTLTKPECVRRARNLNHQAVAYRLGGKTKWAQELVEKRKQYMAATRLFA